MSNVPKLRFKEFGGEWEEKKLGAVTTYVDYRGRAPIKTENGNFLVTAKNIKKGFIDYACSKEYVSEDNYLNVMSKGLPEIGDVLFTTEAPMGNVAQVDIENIALAQRVIKFRAKKMLLNSYLFHYMLSDIFQSLVTKKSIGTTVQGISGKELHQTKLAFPSLQEQEKIASFLTSVDTKIEQLTKKEALLQEYKKGVMNKIFSQEIRFKDDDGSEFPEWEEKNLNELMYEHKERNYEKKYTKNDVLSVSGSHGIVNQIEFQGRSFAGVSVDNYHIVKVDDIVYTKSPLKANPYGIIKTNKYKDGIVSTLYAVYRPKECLFPQYINYYFEIDDNVNKYLRPLVHKGAKNDMKINNQHVLSSYISIPEKKEQTKIANFLSSIDKKIELTTKELNSTKEFKKALLQQMFV